MKIFKRSATLATLAIFVGQLLLSCSTSQQIGKNQSGKDELNIAQNTMPAPKQEMQPVTNSVSAVENTANNQPEESKTIVLASTEKGAVIAAEKKATSANLFVKGNEKASPKKGFINKVKDIKKLNKITGEAKAQAGDNQLIALILALPILPGMLGLHRFYLGYTWQGIVQLVMTVLVVTAFITFIWVVIDFIRILLGKLTPKDEEYGTTLNDL